MGLWRNSAYCVTPFFYLISWIIWAQVFLYLHKNWQNDESHVDLRKWVISGEEILQIHDHSSHFSSELTLPPSELPLFKLSAISYYCQQDWGQSKDSHQFSSPAFSFLSLLTAEATIFPEGSLASFPLGDKDFVWHLLLDQLYTWESCWESLWASSVLLQDPLGRKERTAHFLLKAPCGLSPTENRGCACKGA